MKRALQIIVAVWGLMSISGTTSSAQDFNAFLQAVEEIESNLEDLVKQEAEARTQAFAKLSLRLKAIDVAPTSADQSVQLAELAKAVQQLSVQFQAIQRAEQPTASDNFEEIAGLVAEIELLRSELHSLQNLATAANAPRLASTGDEAAAQIAFAQGGPTESRIEPPSGLIISGFFDINGTYKSSASDNTQFDLGQVELDLDHVVSEKTYVRITPVWNNNTGVLSLGPVFVRVQMMDYDNSPVKELSISAGKFDIPFGLGIYENASANRKIPTRPMAISLTHGGWGDYGVQLDLKFPVANFVAYAVNGFASTAEVDSALSLSLGVPEGTEINTTPSYAFGTRIGLTPISSLEYGMSLAAGQNESNKNEMMLVGADLQYSIYLFDFKGEYFYHSLNRSINETNNRGYYFESRFSSGRWNVATRYGAFKPAGQSWDNRFAVAAGMAINHNVEVKIESLFNKVTDNNSTNLQLVTRF